jgi:hypothetical protein
MEPSSKSEEDTFDVLRRSTKEDVIRDIFSYPPFRHRSYRWKAEYYNEICLKHHWPQNAWRTWDIDNYCANVIGE